MDIFDEKEDEVVEVQGKEDEDITEPTRLKVSSNPVYLSAENLQELTKSSKDTEKSTKPKSTPHALLTEQKLK